MRIEAYAKVNFTLEVFGQRTDGYHALRSLVVPVSLSDTVSVTESSSFSSDSGFADDLSLKAAKVVDPSRGVDVRIVKRIPVGGGLGGGSADAAATLIALNEMRNLGLSSVELAEKGAEVGSDVPALTMGRAVIMEGRGEVVTPLDFDMPSLDLVIAVPEVGCSTPEVYSRCTARPTDAPNATARMLEALKRGEIAAIAEAFVNDLEKVAVSLHPEIAAVKAALADAGALGATMSGSGSSVFALAESASAAEEIVSALAKSGIRAWAVKTI